MNITREKLITLIATAFCEGDGETGDSAITLCAALQYAETVVDHYIGEHNETE
jgi:hypothetical protein